MSHVASELLQTANGQATRLEGVDHRSAHSRNGSRIAGVPVLLTCDIHTHVTGAELVRQDLIAARRLLQSLGLRCTFFFPARSAALLPDQVEALQREGHEIGCHGLTHVPSENYGVLPPATQYEFLQQATDQLTTLLGERPVSFRAPVFKLSRGTIAALDALRYDADLSVTAQRLGVFGSDIYDLRPLFAPRQPYHPALDNPFAQGHARIWEIPISAWGLPFLSNTERLCGLSFMRWFFRALSLEARLTGKPIVFMFHAEDLNGARRSEVQPRLSWRDFIPTRTHGLTFRRLLLEHDWQHVQRDAVNHHQDETQQHDMAVQPGNVAGNQSGIDRRRMAMAPPSNP